MIARTGFGRVTTTGRTVLTGFLDYKATFTTNLNIEIHPWINRIKKTGGVQLGQISRENSFVFWVMYIMYILMYIYSVVPL